MPVYFLTGTDTDAGKTLIGTALLTLARQRGLSTLGLKPVASGCDVTTHGLRNSDALALQAQSCPSVDYATVNPFAFSPAIAPHLAAQHAGTDLCLADLITALTPALAQPRDLTLIEGAGGWRVPLNDDEDLAALARHFDLPVILVVGVRLGAINHARLTLEAIRRDGLRVVGWIANQIDANVEEPEGNMATLDTCLDVPCLGRVPYLDTPHADARRLNAARHLRLP